MAEVNTGGGSSIDGGVNTGGGHVTGRDDRSAHTKISIEARNAIDDLRTDLSFAKEDIGDLKFGQFEMRQDIARLQQQRAEPLLPSSLIDEQRRTNELLRLLVTLLSVLIGGSTIGGVLWILVAVLR